MNQAGAPIMLCHFTHLDQKEEMWDILTLQTCHLVYRKWVVEKKLIDYSTWLCFDESAVHWNLIQVQDL